MSFTSGAISELARRVLREDDASIPANTSLDTKERECGTVAIKALIEEFLFI